MRRRKKRKNQELSKEVSKNDTDCSIAPDKRGIDIFLT